MGHYINAGNTEDIRNAIKCAGDKISIDNLVEDIQEEMRGQNRKTVLNMLKVAQGKRWKALEGEELLANYPKKVVDYRGDVRQLYVRYPIEEDGKWVAVNVALPTGFYKIPTARQYDNARDCAKGCDAENELCGFSGAQVLEICKASFENVEEE